MKFTYNWFNTSGKPNFDKFLLPIKDKEIQCLEIGCFEGQATCWVLENLPKAKISVIDTFEGSEEHGMQGVDCSHLLEIFKSNIELHKDKVNIFQGRSFEILIHLNTVVSSFDFVYVDGSHEAKDVLSDAILSWNLLKKGGLMIFDDYGWTFGKTEADYPKAAIDSFLKCYEGEYKLLLKSYQVVLERI